MEVAESDGAARWSECRQTVMELQLVAAQRQSAAAICRAGAISASSKSSRSGDATATTAPSADAESMSGAERRTGCSRNGAIAMHPP